MSEQENMIELETRGLFRRLWDALWDKESQNKAPEPVKPLRPCWLFKTADGKQKFFLYGDEVDSVDVRQWANQFATGKIVTLKMKPERKDGPTIIETGPSVARLLGKKMSKKWEGQSPDYEND